MFRRVLIFFIVFVFFVLVFFFQKTLFVLMHGSVNEGVSLVDWFQILWHGLPMDMSVSGYMTVIPLFLLIASIWVHKEFLKRMMSVYFSIMLLIVTAIAMIDVIMYKHWGFHLDPVILFYLRNPKDALASGTIWEWLLGLSLTFLIIRGFYYGYCFTIRKLFMLLKRPRRPVLTCSVLVLLAGILFLPIRGGVTVSTMNVSTAYFSDRMFLNHAAINPAFNFFYLLNKHDDFESLYRFFEKEEAGRIFNRLHELPATEQKPSLTTAPTTGERPAPAVGEQPDLTTAPTIGERPAPVAGERPAFTTTPTTSERPAPAAGEPIASATSRSLLRVERPNIILFILESFTYQEATDSTYSPNLVRLAKEGVLFEHFYANSFRTDRGLVSILSGYPGHPTTAILKYPKKTDMLPAIPKYLEMNGYKNKSVYYGGDINFTNMRSYIVGACGIQDIVSDKDFPITKRMTKWGVPDQWVIDRLFHDLTTSNRDLSTSNRDVTTSNRDVTVSNPDEPFLKIVLTLSSHEPFDVPTQLFDVPFLNSIHYVDECIGRFVADLKTTGLWDNTLIIFLSDHTMQSYPKGLNNYDKTRFHIPMIWAGGAIRQPAVISDYGSQNDLAATLLSQLRIDHSDFRFSKDLLHPQGRKFAFYSYVNGFCMMDSTSLYLYDNNQQKTLEQTGDPSMENEAKAFFQMMYIDLGER